MTLGDVRWAAAVGRTYPCIVLGLHDGDTVTVFADRGDGEWWYVDVRLRTPTAGANARELKDPGGPEAREWLRGLLLRVTPLTLQQMFGAKAPRATLTSHGWDKYGGRIEGALDVPGVGDVMTRMVADGYAALWNGRGARPVPPWPVPARLA